MDARLFKFKAPLYTNINNTIPQNHNIQKDNRQANQTDKPNSNTSI